MAPSRCTQCSPPVLLPQGLAAGAHPPMWSVLESIGAVRVRFADAAAFANVNSREDLAAVAARLEVS